MKALGRLVGGIALIVVTVQPATAGVAGSAPHKYVQPAAVDRTATIGVNNLLMVVSNVGSFAYDPSHTFGKSDGLYFPRGTNKTVIYAGGIWVGARVNGAPRLAIGEYTQEFSPGPMDNGTYLPDEGRFHVYNISRGDDASSNPDHANWPFADGAPALQTASGEDSLDADGNRIPLILGDQALYAVYNDAKRAAHTNQAGSTEPLGLEIQQYVFAFSRSAALGNTIYLKFKIINKGTNQLEDTYVSIWADPDVGDAADDLVGCDTSLSLGYAYNEGADPIYGAAAPATGFDFFQGPIVPSPGDTAYQSGRAIPDHRNLPMTSFNKYINGTDPSSSTEAYNYMRGLSPTGDSIQDPLGNTTAFQMAGDPVTEEGWTDVGGDDRRFMMSSGPFNMAPGDTQEVVVAVMVGQGTDHLSSISTLRDVSRQAQAVFDLNFDIPFTPPPPSVETQPLANRIELVWGREADGDVQVSEILGQSFEMEGYNIYQGTSASGPWKKIATFDVDNEFGLLYKDEFEPEIGAIHRALVQSGSNSGLKNHLTITTDRINGGRLINHRPYYFAITAYSVDVNNVEEYSVDGAVVGHLAEVLETRVQGVEVIPNSVALNGIIDAEHIAGTSEGAVVVNYFHPEEITGHTYEVSFNEDYTWNLQDLTTEAMVLTDQENQSADFDNVIVDGMMVQPSEPTPGLEDVSWEGGDQWVTSVPLGVDWFDGGFMPGSWFFGSSLMDKDMVNVEIRFSNTTTQKAYRYLRGGQPSYGFVGFDDIPLTAWDVSADPPRQLNVCFVENFGLATQDATWLPDEDPNSREYLFIMNSDYSETPDDFYTSRNIYWDAYDLDMMYAWWPMVADGHTNLELADGQMILAETAKINRSSDRFVFTTTRAGEDAIAKGEASLDGIHPLPNPYFLATNLEGSTGESLIKFVGLPATDATVEIYNLAGELIRTLQKEDLTGSEMTWDVLTEHGLPPASGIYIYRVVVDGVGQKVGKIALFTEVEQLRRN